MDNEQQTYFVSWEIEIDASSPEEAARIAREYQLDPSSEATVFDVTDEGHTTTQVDLSL